MSLPGLPAGLVALWFFSVLSLAWLNRRQQATSLKPFLLRALLPSWKFFDQIGVELELGYRVSHDGGNYGPWLADPLPPRPTKPHFDTLFLNPEGNLRLAEHSLLEHLVQDANCLEPAQADLLANAVSYRLVTNLARARIHERDLSKDAESFQFRIRTASLATNEDILVSPPHPLCPPMSSGPQ